MAKVDDFARADYVASMKLWVDADAAPRDVKEIVFRAAERLSLHTVLVANQRIQLPLGYKFVSAEQLIDDFFDEVERLLTQRGIELVVVETTERKTS